MDEGKVKEVLEIERQKHEQLRKNLTELIAKIEEMELEISFTAGRISVLEDMLGAWDRRIEAQDQTEAVVYRAPFSRQ